MSEKLPEQPASEEVDLGQLFKLIGEGLNKVVNFFKSIFQYLFNLLIQFLLLIKRNFIVIAAIVLITGGIGFFFDKTTPNSYAAELILETNYDSQEQLYANINLYNSMAQQLDSLGLKAIFPELTMKEILNLRRFSIAPIYNEEYIFKKYNDLIEVSDSATVNKNISFKDFKNNINYLDIDLHKIKVQSKNNYSFKKLQAPIINFPNPYLEKQKRITISNLEKEKMNLEKQLNDIEKWKTTYAEVLTYNAKESNSGGTNILLSGKETKQTHEMELFKLEENILERISMINKTLLKKSEIINVISPFPSSGYQIKGITQKMTFNFAAVGIVLFFLFLAFKSINLFLSNYKKEDNIK